MTAKRRVKITHVNGHALCQACEEARPDNDQEHDRYADVCGCRDLLPTNMSEPAEVGTVNVE